MCRLGANPKRRIGVACHDRATVIMVVAPTCAALLALFTHPPVRLRSTPSMMVASVESGDAISTALQADGVVRVRGAITEDMAESLLTFVDASLEGALRETRDYAKFGEEWKRRFGDVKSPSCRHDLKLSPKSPPVRAALAALLSTLQPAIAKSLGDDAQLYELAAMISLPGSARQAVHADTPIAEGTADGATVLTAFCALQDIDATMGPTVYLPATHTAEAHADFFCYDNFDLLFSSTSEEDEEEDDDEEEREARMEELLESWSAWRSELRTGDVSLYDGRCLHAGEANNSPRQRVLFYCSFIRADHVIAATRGTLLDDLRASKLKLADWREWLDGDETVEN